MNPAARPPVETPPLAPLQRFGVVLGWGVRRGLRSRRFLVVLAACALVGFGLGVAVSMADDPAFALWELLNVGVLGTGIPLVALAVVAGGFGEEVQDQTLVHHLVRPVSRTTVFVARYASGALSGLVCAVGLTAAVMLGARADVPVAAWAGTLAAAALGVVTVGALYYALAALFRRGLVAGLVYTFVVEGFFQGLPGTVQKLALTHHVRSVFHRLADPGFARASHEVAGEVARGPQPMIDSQFFRAIEVEPWSSLPGAFLLCALVAAGTLWVGARAVRRKDFALKD